MPNEQCDKCKQPCERIEQKKDPEMFYLCCKCSGSYIDSLCDLCQERITDCDMIGHLWEHLATDNKGNEVYVCRQCGKERIEV